MLFSIYGKIILIQNIKNIHQVDPEKNVIGRQTDRWTDEQN